MNTLSANPFHSKMYRHTYKSTRNIENYGKVLRFQSENVIEYTYYIVKLVLASALEFIFIFILMLELKLCPPNTEGGGIYCFGADPVGVSVGVSVHFFVSVHKIMQLLDFDQTCIHTLLGEGKKLIRFW